MRWLLLIVLAGCDWVAGLQQVPPLDAPDARPPDGMIARWTMDTIANGVVADVRGSRDGTCTSCPTMTDGSIGGALLFDGVTEHVDAPGDKVLSLRQFTVTAWIKQDVGSNDSVCPLNKVVGSGGANSWQLCLISDGELDFITTSAGSGGELFSGMTNEIKFDTWTFIALSFNGSQKAVIIDDSEAASTDADVPLYDMGMITFGADQDSGAAKAYFGGAIDDVRIYDHALSSVELAGARAGT